MQPCLAPVMDAVYLCSGVNNKCEATLTVPSQVEAVNMKTAVTELSQGG